MKPKWIDRTALLLPRITVCTSQKQLRKLCKRVHIEVPADAFSNRYDASVFTIRADGIATICIVALKIKPDRPLCETVALIAHECVHIKQKMMADIEEENPGYEIEAYIVESAVREVMREYLRQAMKHHKEK